VRKTSLVASRGIGQQDFAPALVVAQHRIGKRPHMLATDLRGALDRMVDHCVRRGLAVFKLVKRRQQQAAQLCTCNRFARQLVENRIQPSQVPQGAIADILDCASLRRSQLPGGAPHRIERGIEARSGQNVCDRLRRELLDLQHGISASIPRNRTVHRARAQIRA